MWIVSSTLIFKFRTISSFLPNLFLKLKHFSRDTRPSNLHRVLYSLWSLWNITLSLFHIFVPRLGIFFGFPSSAHLLWHLQTSISLSLYCNFLSVRSILIWDVHQVPQLLSNLTQICQSWHVKPLLNLLVSDLLDVLTNLHSNSSISFPIFSNFCLMHFSLLFASFFIVISNFSTSFIQIWTCLHIWIYISERYLLPWFRPPHE